MYYGVNHLGASPSEYMERFIIHGDWYYSLFLPTFRIEGIFKARVKNNCQYHWIREII